MRKTLNISAQNRYPAIESEGRSRRKYIYFLLVPILLFFFILLNEGFSQNIKIILNDWDIRYDTFSVSFEESIPNQMQENIRNELEKVEHNGKKRFSFEDYDADIHISFVDKEDAIFTDYLIPVGHFYWIENSLSTDDIEKKKIVVEEANAVFVEKILERYLDVKPEVEEKDDVLSYLRENEENAISFVNFQELDYNYQLLYFNEKYFLDDFEGGVEFGVGVEIISAPEFLSDVIKENSRNVYEEISTDDIAKVNMSGVTALTRNLAFKIEEAGDPAYPAEYIADFLGDADLVHTSNEVSFVPNCQPERSMSFCSHPNYIETLEAINANVIELTGNHNNDFGREHNENTIEMYKERGWGYYGGGLDEEDAREILFKEVKGSKIAFIGYNYYDSIHQNHRNLAIGDGAGANSFSFEKMEEDIKKANEEGALTIVTFQFEECWSYPPSDVIFPPCYKPLSNPDQKHVFRTALDYGADIVIGSQAHQPQTYEIYDGKPIFYGTGNIFFDQIPWIGTRQGMILTHYVYENRLLQSKITTTLYDDDMRPYTTDGEDRELLLELLRDARD